MTDAAALLADLRRQGVHLARSGDGLDVAGPPALLTDALLSTVRQHKADLLRLLADAPPDAAPPPARPPAAALPPPQPDPAAPCPACGCGAYWHAADGWRCEGCTPAPPDATRWRHVAGGKPPAPRPPALPWPPGLTADLRRVAAAFEWTDADRRGFIAWARRSAQGLADAGAFLAAEAAKLPPPGLEDRRAEVLALLADDPALRVAWTCADDGESDPVLLTLALRGRGTCELAIPRAGFDALALPQLIGELVERGET